MDSAFENGFLKYTVQFLTALSYSLFYILICAGLSAILAYPLFLVFGLETSSTFRELVIRGAYVFIVVGLYPVLKYFGIAFSAIGLESTLFRHAITGFSCGVVMLGLHVVALLILNIRIPNHTMPEWLGIVAILFKAFSIAIPVALLEEILFRGVLFAALRKYYGAILAVAVSAFYYSALHFLRSRWNGLSSEIDWATGFAVLADSVHHFTTLPFDSFFALWCAGLLLGCIRVLFPGGLGYCLGIHAGWVFVIKTAKPLTHVVTNAPWLFLISRYDWIIGYFSSIWTVGLITIFLLRKKREKTVSVRLYGNTCD